MWWLDNSYQRTFLDHTPAEPNAANEQLMQAAYLETRNLYIENFGEDIYVIMNPCICFFRKRFRGLKRFIASTLGLKINRLTAIKNMHF